MFDENTLYGYYFWYLYYLSLDTQNLLLIEQDDNRNETITSGHSNIERFYFRCTFDNFRLLLKKPTLFKSIFL
jgi:hypothetical protein